MRSALMLLSVCGVVACEPGTCDADEGVLLQAKSLIRKHKQTPPTEEFDSRLSAYWDTGTCGAEVDDDYNWAWCGGTKASESGDCPTTISTDICDSGVAELAEFHGTGDINSYTRDGCNYYWHAQYRCTPAPVESPYYYVVNSWPEDAWGPWDAQERESPIEKCVARDLMEDPDGSGYMFTSCCTVEGIGMSRVCRSEWKNNNFENAKTQCASQDGRLCTVEEAMSQETVSQGCSVDGPRSAKGGDLNRLWTSTPCTPAIVEPTPPASCPAGWDQKGALGADIGGCGLQGCDERYDLSSEIECAARCDATWTCQAFSWAPLNGDRNHPGDEACTIYNSDVPTGNLTGVDGTASQVLCGRSFWARLGSEAIGTNTCPAGMEGISQEDCWEAGQRLLPTGVSSDEQDLKLGSWNHVPPGCIVRHGNFNILFNSNPTATNTDDWVPICSN